MTHTPRPPDEPMHAAEVRRTADRRRWFARCACGWTGAPRDTRAEADVDATVHDITENRE